MKQLGDILSGVDVLSLHGSRALKLRSLCIHSSQVCPGDLFLAQKGGRADGHAYIKAAMARGASAIVCEDLPVLRKPSITYVQVSDARKALATLSSNWFDHPSERLALVGVTGTNGKTSVALLLYGLFRALGYRVGLLSSLYYKAHETQWTATLTTPDAWALNGMLASMLEAGCTHAFMEVSSHAVMQRRIDALHFRGGIFTNISHDHLDYHERFADYLNAKRMFFDSLPARAFALVNADDTHHRYMLQNTQARTVTYALKAPADHRARVLENHLEGLDMEVQGQRVSCRLTGVFNAYNLLAAAVAAELLGEESAACWLKLSQAAPIDGRFEPIPNARGVHLFVDYAHTPDALEKILTTLCHYKRLPQHRSARVITVVGCGGNRDREKRPKMGLTACLYSDVVIFTSDNPRDEDPRRIIADMQAQLRPEEQQKGMVEVDRKAALTRALRLAVKGDMVLIAGKGHEAYQDIAGVRHPYQDKQVLQSLWKEGEEG